MAPGAVAPGAPGARRLLSCLDLDMAFDAASFVDTETGAVRTAGHGRGRATGGRTNWTSGPAIAALGTEPGVRAVTLAAEQESRSARSASGGIALRELTVMGDSGVRVIPLAGELFEQSWGFRRAWITGDGRLGVEFNALSINAQAGRPERFIDLATGAVTSEPSVAAANQPTVPGVEWLSPDGARLARITTELSDSGTVTRIGVEVTPVARSRPTTDERQPRRRRPPRAPATASSAAAPGAGTGLAR
ncbi:MAG: hypothetical protein EBU31_02495 [Proteobacteria bacterium]|nr:hypothetical protein [Pseudomonadota bacterium]